MRRNRDGLDRHDDQGSALIIAVVVMMVLTTLTLALLARTLSTMSFIRHGQDFDAALAAADAGLSQAVYRIENGASATWEEAGVNGLGSYRFVARRVTPVGTPANEFIVSSKGRVGNGRHAIEAKVTRSALFPFALFGYQNLRMDGSTVNGPGFQFYVVGSAGAPVSVGSNGLITCNGTMASNVWFKSASGFSGCPSGQWANLEPRQYRLELDPPPSPSQACPSGGVFTGFVDGGGGLPYVCRQDVVFSGVVNVTNGPLKVYVLNSLKPSGVPDPDVCHSLSIAGAVINAGAPARQVQIYKDDDCLLDIGDGNTVSQLTFSGVLYAPDSTVTINGGKWFTGSLMVGQVRSNGSPNLVIGYDSDLQTYYGPEWRVSRYGEVPSAAVTFPSGLEP